MHIPTKKQGITEAEATRLSQLVRSTKQILHKTKSAHGITLNLDPDNRIKVFGKIGVV